jgi:hypothetical protein
MSLAAELFETGGRYSVRLKYLYQFYAGQKRNNILMPSI